MSFDWDFSILQSLEQGMPALKLHWQAHALD